QLWKTPEPAAKAQVEWACATAAARLEVFTPKELAAFWEAVDPAEARSWCQEALKEGRIEQARIESHSAPPQQGYVLAGWERRLAHLPEASPDLRFLNPFDPVLRDRDRALRRFDLAYRFEAFTPEAKRAYGYYVLPILEGKRFIGRLDPKFHRDRGVLEVRGLWWEAGQRVSAARRRKLDAALEAFAAFLGGTYQGMPKNR
ncbi:MAG: winged helix DNA-binding domain-containing protein, partial [Firmicutes bacterium]|nr:winged helix DNA-binding domain-containing protein [Bacillota bacterium]